MFFRTFTWWAGVSVRLTGARSLPRNNDAGPGRFFAFVAMMTSCRVPRWPRYYAMAPSLGWGLTKVTRDDTRREQKSGNASTRINPSARNDALDRGWPAPQLHRRRQCPAP